MQILTHKEAKDKRVKRYFTGQPCNNHGHICERLTSSGECIECKKLREARKYREDSSSHKEYYQKNRDRLLQQQKVADDNRRTEKIEYGQNWRKANAEYAKIYRGEHADLYRFHAAKRRASRRKATPSWFEYEEVKALYVEADRISKETGIPHQVDHIIPLINQEVCGLHCLANLQIITEEENRRKKNSFSQEQGRRI